MLQTKMKSTDLAKKLRLRLKELTARRKGELTKYERAVNAWKTAMAKWVKLNGPKKIAALPKSDLKEHNGRWRNNPGFSTEMFWNGCPSAPKYPDDKQARAVRTLLRQLGITGQQTVHLGTDEVKKLFMDEGDDDS